MTYHREYFQFDPKEEVYRYVGPIKSPRDIWRGITVGYDDNQDMIEVNLEHPNGNIIEHFDNLDEVDDYLDKVFLGKIC